MPAAEMPAAEVDITVDVVAGLVGRQFPDLADRAITPFEHGWDNDLFRLGHDLLVRLPRRAEGVPLVEHEHRWLAELTTDLATSLQLGTPVHRGAPDAGFPWPWSITRYLPGRSVLTTIDAGDPFDLADAADRLAGFLAAFHRPAPADAPVNDWRGVPIADRLPRFRTHRDALDGVVDPDVLAAVDAAVADAVAAPVWDGPPQWLHGDVHPGNLVAFDGRLTGVVDFGDLTSGDPATDLSAAWTLLDAATRPGFQAQFPHGPDLWRRARGWTAVLGVAVVANTADNPPFARMGQRMLAEVAADR